MEKNRTYHWSNVRGALQVLLVCKHGKYIMQNQDEITTARTALPRGFEINFHDDYMQITQTWFSVGKIIAILIFVLIFNGVGPR